MGNQSARVLQKLLNDDPSLKAFLDAVDSGSLTEQQIQAWIEQNRARILSGLLSRWPDLPQLRSVIPSRPPPDGWSPRLELGIATLGVDSPAVTVGRPGGPRHVIGLLPPDTASLALGAGPASGSGQLQVRDGRVSGTLGLLLGSINVNGLALVETQGNVPSIVVVLGIRFIPPLQLSFGFALTAVGGVIGVHRRIDGDALRARLADGSALDALFPSNPADGAGRMLAALAAIFQPALGQHVVGPTFSLTWLDVGMTTLVRMDVGVLVQFPDGRVAIVGRAALDLGPILALRIDVFGEIDPGRKLVAVDGVLVDSRAMGIFRVTGTATFRSSAADPPYVIAALGGFYPGYQPEPAAIPPSSAWGCRSTSPARSRSARAATWRSHRIHSRRAPSSRCRSTCRSSTRRAS